MTRIPGFLCALATTTIALTLSGCGGGAKSGGATEKSYSMALVNEPKHLDPAFSYDYYEGVANGLLFDNLVNFGAGTEIEPALAEKWEISEDGTSYTFHLRDAKFSNGKPVTSADVQYSYSRLLWPGTNSDRKWTVQEIDGYDEVTSGTAKSLKGLATPDPRTVVIKLSKPYPPFLTKIAMPNGAIIPENSAGTDKPDREFDKKPIGAGPWVLEKWVHDQRLEFRRNEHYWKGKFPLDRLTAHIQKEDQVLQQQYKIGKLDQYTVGFTSYPNWVKDPEKKKTMIESPELNIYYLAFNNEKPKLNDKRVRQAISMGIDVRNIFERVQLGRGTMPHGPIPPGMTGYRADIKPRPYDPDQAKALLKEAGAEGMTITMWWPGDPLTDEIMAAAKADLEKLGLKPEMYKRELLAFREGVYNGEADMFYWSWWLDYPDVENSLIPSFASFNIPRKGNGCRYSNPEFDKIITGAQYEKDVEKRIAAFQKAEDLVIEDCPWVFLYHRKSYIAVQNWISGYKPTIMYNSTKLTDVDIDLSKKK